MRSLAVAGAAFLAACAAFAQPAFEVASVKPSTEADRVIGFFTYPGGRIVATNYTLKMYLHEAWDIEDFRISGGPHWVAEDRYNIEAKPAASSPLSQWAPANFKSPPNPEMRLMLQTLLADRFQLKVHRESKKDTIYALAVNKGGHRLKPPASTTVQPFVSFPQGGFLRGQNATMDQLVERLATFLKHPVQNQTAIEGHFDFDLSRPPDDSDTDLAVALMRALQDQLGLKLETRPGVTDILVIDRAEKPSGN